MPGVRIDQDRKALVVVRDRLEAEHHQLASDGSQLGREAPQEELLMPPGSRVVEGDRSATLERLVRRVAELGVVGSAFVDPQPGQALSPALVRS